MSLFFFFNDTATTEIYTLSLHDALPIYAAYYLKKAAVPVGTITWTTTKKREDLSLREACNKIIHARSADFHYESSRDRKSTRLNSSHSQISYAVFCLKKKTSIRIFLHAT